MVSIRYINSLFCVFCQEGKYTCRDCEKLVDDMQDTIKNNPFLVQSLAAHAKSSCDLLVPEMADEVMVLLKEKKVVTALPVIRCLVEIII